MSKRALLALLSIIATMLQVLGSHNSTLQFLAKHIPTSEYKLKQSLPHKGKDQFTKYVVCKRCYSLYKLHELMKKSRCSQIHCSHIAWPDHPHQERRQPCGTPLLHEVTFSHKENLFYPQYIYCYNIIVQSLSDLLSRPGIPEQLELWRHRSVPSGHLGDVYDGKIWKEFVAITDGFSLSKPRHYAGILNVDWFQPFKNGTTSVGVIYLALMNFPRHLRFKRENVLLVGIIPALKPESASPNAFLKPLVDVLKAMWEDGVLLTTSQSPTFRLQHRLALLCVSCDIPASG